MEHWWQGAVIYQIYPRSFCDSNGDGVGDLPGIGGKLDYVAALGVDGIWLSPFFVSPMKDHGYDVADYCDVDPVFGTLGDFDRLLAEAHRRGLKVIIDQVYSHSSDQHPWFQESRQSRDNPKADWYVWADPKPDGMPPNNWLSVFGGVAWEWEPRRRQYYFHNFLKEQPDLNFHNPAVQDAVLAAAEFWLKRGVDGFRIDVANLFCHDRHLRDNPAVPHPAPDRPMWLQRQIYTRNRPETLGFVARFRRLLDRYPGTMAVAELASGEADQTMVAYTDGPDRYHTAYNFSLLREGPPAAVIRRSLEAVRALSETAWPAWAFSNHDVERVVSRWGRDAADPEAFAKLMIACLVSLRGTIFLYQGEELGLPHGRVPLERMQDPEAIAFWPRHVGRDGARTPMPWQAAAAQAGFSAVEPWLPVDPAHAVRAVDRQQADGDSVLMFTRRLLQWRRGQPALQRGDIAFIDVPPPVLAFIRRWHGAAVVAAFNVSGDDLEVTVPTVDAARPLEAPGVTGRIDGSRAILPAYAAAFATLPGGGQR